MNVLIANNDHNKTKRLAELLYQIDKKINIVYNPATTSEVIDLLSENNTEIDLAILSIQNTNGSVKDLINLHAITNPLIFTSDSKEDAYEAWKANCVDFVLEPLDFSGIAQAISKAKEKIELNEQKKYNFKKRFIIKFGDKIQYKTVDDISYIYAEGKMAYIMTRPTNRKYIIEYTLDELEKTLLDPVNFYRINRKFIVNIDAIEEARQYVNSRLKLILNPATDFDMVVSREKVHDFKRWLNL
ncbi:MAG: LytTR family transcriptional regulator DNA-binding domain-containing protein [Cytophagales bacterium]|nr:LytTR family transcriptional regulator DNA-binding domain-containing protein [Cytophagales bacterium]